MPAFEMFKCTEEINMFTPWYRNSFGLMAKFHIWIWSQTWTWNLHSGIIYVPIQVKSQKATTFQYNRGIFFKNF